MIDVSGQVVDATTGDGIPSATLAVNGTPVGAADTDGNFTVQVASYNDTIKASSVGYVALSMPASQVMQSGEMRMGIDAESLAAVTVTPHKKSDWGWWALAGVAVIASQKSTHSISGKGSNLVPIALLGVGALLLLQAKKSPVSSVPGSIAPYAPITSVPGSNSSILNNGGISNLTNLFKGLFGSSNDPSFVPVGVQPIPGTGSSSPAANFPTIPGGSAPIIPISPGAYGDQYSDIEDYASNFLMSGTGMGTSFNAGDLIGHTLTAAQQVPVYHIAGDSQKPVGFIAPGNPVGVVASWLDPNPAADRAELWWAFQTDNVFNTLGNDYGNYYSPHKAGLYDVQSLIDQGVLTTAEATALQQAKNDDSTGGMVDSLIKKYGPYILGGFIVLGLGKAVINKVI